MAQHSRSAHSWSSQILGWIAFAAIGLLVTSHLVASRKLERIEETLRRETEQAAERHRLGQELLQTRHGAVVQIGHELQGLGERVAELDRRLTETTVAAQRRLLADGEAARLREEQLQRLELNQSQLATDIRAAREAHAVLVESFDRERTRAFSSRGAESSEVAQGALAAPDTSRDTQPSPPFVGPLLYRLPPATAGQQKVDPAAQTAAKPEMPGMDPLVR